MPLLGRLLKDQCLLEGAVGISGQVDQRSEIVYFKLYQRRSQCWIAAIENAALMLGSDRSRGYCLQTICDPSAKKRVNTMRPRVPRLRLDAISYEILRQQVLRRDGWRCQVCGTMSNLEVHHREFRSHYGEDSELNLITLCHHCHREAHG